MANISSSDLIDKQCIARVESGSFYLRHYRIRCVEGLSDTRAFDRKGGIKQSANQRGIQRAAWTNNVLFGSFDIFSPLPENVIVHQSLVRRINVSRIFISWILIHVSLTRSIQCSIRIDTHLWLMGASFRVGNIESPEQMKCLRLGLYAEEIWDLEMASTDCGI